MRVVVYLLTVLFLAAASSAVAQEKHLIDPMLPGSLDPKPLPPLKNPDAPSTPAKELFARQLGYVEGQNIAFEFRSGEGQLDRLPRLAAELVQLKVDVIVALY